MSLPWFRMYAAFMGDPVIQALAFEDQRHYVVVLCLKCDGVLDRKVADAVKERLVSRALGLDPAATAEAKRRLMEVGLVTEKWQPRAWNKRQYKSDVSTERVRKHRKNKETGNVSETLRNRFGNGPDTDTDTEDPPLPPQGAKRTEKPGRSRFVPPTVEEVREYVRERGSSVDPQRWHDHYTAKGWRVGKTPMKDWRAAVRTWERDDQPADDGRRPGYSPEVGYYR